MTGLESMISKPIREVEDVVIMPQGFCFARITFDSTGKFQKGDVVTTTKLSTPVTADYSIPTRPCWSFETKNTNYVCRDKKPDDLRDITKDTPNTETPGE